jgi:hypothetical protein
MLMSPVGLIPEKGSAGDADSCYFILVYSQHVSALTCHPHVKYNITLFEVPSMLQRIRCSLIVTYVV